MAVTKIWAVKDSLSRVVSYAKNPNKTIFNDLKQVLMYAENDEKTIDENEKTMYVSGINCNRETAYEEMMEVQKRFNKKDGNIAYHAYQSFKTGEATPELAHKIGVQTAERMWKGHQVIVATHFNTGTYHNHFVINSVNMFTGKKFDCNIGAYYKFREISDDLCRENNLIVIENPKGKTPRNIYFAEKRGEPTKYNLMREAIKETVEECINFGQFKKIMLKKGYVINDDYNRKYPTIRSINDKKATRLYRLGEQYTKEKIVKKLEKNPYYYQEEYLKITKPKKQYNRDIKHYNYKNNFNDMSKMTGLEVIFLLLFYLMGLYKPRENNKQVYRPRSPELKEAIRKMDRYSQEVTLVSTEKLKTTDDVKDFIIQTESKIEDETKTRQSYRNKLRRCTNEKEIKELKEKISSITSVLQEYRKKIKTARQVIEDIPDIKEKIRIEQEMKINERTQERKGGDKSYE